MEVYLKKKKKIYALEIKKDMEQFLPNFFGKFLIRPYISFLSIKPLSVLTKNKPPINTYKGLFGATALQKKQSTTVKRKGKRAVLPEPVSSAIIAAGIKIIGDGIKSIFGNEITETTTHIEQNMVSSTERGPTGIRPILLNLNDRKQPEHLKSINLNEPLNEYKMFVSNMMSASLSVKFWVNMGLYEKMNDTVYIKEIVDKIRIS